MLLYSETQLISLKGVLDISMGKKILNLLLFLLITAGLVVMTLFFGREQKSVMLYNFCFLGAMAVLYMAGMLGGMFRMDDLAGALKRAAAEITSIFKIPGKISAGDLPALEGMFENRYLDKKLKDFENDIDKSQEGIGDIEDYINEEELSIHVHRRLMELVPDIFTSLGILGTFVGLVWGLKSFNPGSYETMTSSVGSLVDGIKVAFLTSIYGIAYSIIYSYGAKSEYSFMTEKLAAFLNKFHSYVMPSAENESRNLLVSSQKIQTDAMNKMTGQFTEQLAASFEQVITPTFQKMNDSLDTLVTSVTQVQTEAIQDILNVFLKEMRSSFQLQFDDFNMAMEMTRKAQEDNVNYTAGLYQSLSGQLQESYSSQEKAMRESAAAMADMQTKLTASVTQMTKDTQAVQKELSRDYQHVMDYMKDAEQSAAKFWVACNQTMKRYVEAAASSMENISTESAGGVQVVEGGKKVVESFEEKMKEFNQYQQLSYQTLEQVQRLLSDISAAGTGDVYLKGGRNQELNQQRSLDRIHQLLEEQGEREQAVLEEINTNLKEYAKTSSKGKFNLFSK